MAGATPVQTQEDIVPPPPTALGYRWAGVLLAPAVAVATQVVLEGPVGLDLQTPDGGSGAAEDLGLLTTAVVALVAGLVGWLIVVLLQRTLGHERGRRVWVLVALAALVASIAYVAVIDVPASTAWGLVALHSVVALVLIPALAARGTPGPVPTTNSPNPPTVEPAHHAHHDGSDPAGHDTAALSH